MKKSNITITMWLLLITCNIAFRGSATAQDTCQPVGWATQNGSVTGGGNTSPTVAADYNALKSALTTESVKVVHVSGTITIPAGGRITVQDQTGKTITGLSGSRLVSTDLSKDGSGIMYIKRCQNFIMRNLVFEGPGAYDTDGYDNLCIDNCQNFWVDHCEFHDGMDGNFDIKNMSDFISVTWCTFSYEKTPIAGGSGGSDDHRYTNLIGSSDNATDDDGHLNVTFYYCWWDEGCRERMPRMRYGKLHMVNSLFSSSVSNHCIRAGYKADVLAVGNYFDNQKLPIDEYESNYTAIRAYNNYGANDLTKNTAFTPPYSITVASPSTIVNPIKSCAGATLTSPTGCSSCGESVTDPTQPSLTATTTTQTIDSGKAITPIVFTWGDAATDVSYTELPAGLSASKDSSAKTLTITGTPEKNGSFSVTTTGGTPAVTISVSIIIKISGDTLADWYPFQESTIALKFVSFTDGSVEPDYYDQSKPDNGVAYSSGALRLNKATGSMTLTLQSLEELKFRWYATGSRSLQVTYGSTGNEKTWNSSSAYESGAHELDLTSTIPELIGFSPVIVTIINNRTDGGSFNIHDLYVKGTEILSTPVITCERTSENFRNDSIEIVNNGSTLQLCHRGAIHEQQPVLILNLLGKAIPIQRNTESIDISKLEKGIYLLKIGECSRKFIKR